MKCGIKKTVFLVLSVLRSSTIKGKFPDRLADATKIGGI